MEIEKVPYEISYPVLKYLVEYLTVERIKNKYKALNRDQIMKLLTDPVEHYFDLKPDILAYIMNIMNHMNLLISLF